MGVSVTFLRGAIEVIASDMNGSTITYLYCGWTTRHYSSGKIENIGELVLMLDVHVVKEVFVWICVLLLWKM